jgi:hypothetical protein
MVAKLAPNNTILVLIQNANNSTEAVTRAYTNVTLFYPTITQTIGGDGFGASATSVTSAVQSGQFNYMFLLALLVLIPTAKPLSLISSVPNVKPSSLPTIEPPVGLYCCPLLCCLPLHRDRLLCSLLLHQHLVMCPLLLRLLAGVAHILHINRSHINRS